MPLRLPLKAEVRDRKLLALVTPHVQLVCTWNEPLPPATGALADVGCKVRLQFGVACTTVKTVLPPLAVVTII